jgi:hypothetical protein
MLLTNALDLLVNRPDLIARLTLGNKDDMYIVRYDALEVQEPEFSLVDSHHPLGSEEVDLPQSVPNQYASGILLRGMQPRVYHKPCLIARKVEPGPAHALAPGSVCALGPHLGKKLTRLGSIEALDRSLEPGHDRKRQGSTVLHFNSGVLYVEELETLLKKIHNRLAVHGLDLGLESDRDPA